MAGVRARPGHRLAHQGRPRAAVLARLVGPFDQDLHSDRRLARARERANAVRDLGLRGRVLGGPYEEPLSGRAPSRVRTSRRGACTCVHIGLAHVYPWVVAGRAGPVRAAEQTVVAVSDPEQKLEMARLRAELGIDGIEAGFPGVSQEAWRAVELIAGAGLRAEVWGFSRAVPADLEALVELGVPASVIESPISDLKLDAIGVPREKMLDRITSAMQFAAEHGIHAAFFGVDSTRAAPDFYERVYKSAVDAGAKEVVVVDTLGIASPEAVAELVGRTVDWAGADVPVHFHGHNDFGLATASAVAAVRAG